MTIDGQTHLYGIFGDPVEHTLSPDLLNTAFRAAQMNAVYVAFRVPPRGLKEALDAAQCLGLRGLNLTLPHKEEALRWMDTLTPEAKSIGAVNTVRFEKNKRVGHNTDGEGFLQSLKKDAGLTPAGKKFLVLGAGGAARAVASSLAKEKAKQVTIANRTRKRARRLAFQLSRFFPGVSIAGQGLPRKLAPADVAAFDVIVNATRVGLDSKDPLLAESKTFTDKHWVCDLVYRPAETPLLKLAKQCGASTLPGAGMLLYQAAASFEFWIGKRAPLDTMRRALTSALRENSR